MRAFVLTGYGAISDNVRLAEIPCPVAAPGEVLIEVHAASLNPIDFKLVHGALKRISKYKLPRPIGFDASGIVVSAGGRPTPRQQREAGGVLAARPTPRMAAQQEALPQHIAAPVGLTVTAEVAR